MRIDRRALIQDLAGVASRERERRVREAERRQEAARQRILLELEDMAQRLGASPERLTEEERARTFKEIQAELRTRCAAARSGS